MFQFQASNYAAGNVYHRKFEMQHIGLVFLFPMFSIMWKEVSRKIKVTILRDSVN